MLNIGDKVKSLISGINNKYDKVMYCALMPISVYFDAVGDKIIR